MRALLKFVRITYLWIVLLPVGLSTFGATLNQIVLVVNHDRFPVMMNTAKLFEYRHSLDKTIDGSEDGNDAAEVASTELDHGFLDSKHVIATPATKLNWLADCIDLGDGMYSIGDLLIDLGAWLAVFVPFVWGSILCLKVYRLTV